MKKITLLAFVITAFALPAFAQSAKLATPKTYPSATDAIVRAFCVDDRTSYASVTVSFATDATGATTREETRIDIPANASSAPGETGSVRRRANFRIVQHLCAVGRLICQSTTP